MAAARAGRPLDAEATRRIHRAALDQLARRGFAAMTMEGVAEAAAVGKPALYRRHRDKAELVVAALGAALPELHPPPRGDPREALAGLLEQVLGGGETARVVAMAAGLLAVADDHPELMAAYRERVLEPRRALAVAVVRRAQEHGDVRAGVDPDQAVDALTGQILARLWRGGPLDRPWRERTLRWWWSWAGA